MAKNEKLDFLDETGEAVEAEVVEEPTEEEAPEPEQAEAAPEPEPEEPTGEDEQKAAPPVATEEDQGRIPVTALLDEREKRQKLERELQELRQWREQQQRQAQQQSRPKPDFFDNPEAAIQQATTAVKLQQSRWLAEKEYGADLVNEAYAYFDQNPQESQALLQHPSPFHAAVEHYKRQQFLNEVKDPDQWREQERERLRQEILAEAQSQSSRPAAPPPSMAKAPSTGRDAIAPGNAFDGLFSD